MSAVLSESNRASHSGKPWLAAYPAGVPGEIALDPSTSLIDLLETGFRRHAHRPACVFLDRELRFRDIEQLSSALGAWLQSKGLQAGARVALMLPNTPQYMVAIAGVLRAGYVVVNVNPLYTPRELEHQLADSGAEAIIVLENFGHVLEEVIERTRVRHVILASMGDLAGFWKGLLVNVAVRHLKKMVPEFRLPIGAGRSVTRFTAVLGEGESLHLRRPTIDGNAIAFLQYTGGTTGVSKGATLLHRNVVANIVQFEAWMTPATRQYDEKPLSILCALPLYHIYALTVCFFVGVRLGYSNLLIPNPRDLAGLVSAVEKHPVNIFPAVNTLFNALVDHPDFRRLDFSHLLLCAGGGMAVQASTAERWKRLTGRAIIEGYGLSETSPVATSNRVDLESYSGTIGLPVPSTDISIRDDEGKEVQAGEPGEICIRGPQVMAGYWNRPDETALVMTPDGFFRSGDIGVMDASGYIRIVDRKKDMILVSGFNVYPNEIEQVVSLHPDVLECAAVGVADERTGEAVKLFVVKRNDALEEDTLLRYCKENFTAYKRPKYIEFRGELPKSNVGKILRRELRNGAR